MPYPSVQHVHWGSIALRDETKDAIRRFGDRLDWVYPPERSDELLDVIQPLFREAGEDARDASDEAGATTDGTRLG